MASGGVGVDQELDSVCSVCLSVTGDLKTVGPCKHYFCVPCLKRHVKDLAPGSETFCCPNCQKPCALPLDGVDGLRDWFPGVEEESPIDSEAASEERQTCQMCEFKGQPESVAEFLCEKCDKMTMCKPCKDKHLSLSATSKHVVTSLRTKRAGPAHPTCGQHGKALKLFCNNCECFICVVCCTLEHDEHHTVEVVEAIRVEIDNVQDLIQKGEVKLEELGDLTAETNAATNVLIGWREKMNQKVEEAAEKLIQRIIDRKEKLKGEIKAGCDVEALTEMLERVPVVEQSIQDCMRRGKAVLRETSLESEFLLQVKKMGKELSGTLKKDDFEKDLQWERLQQHVPFFVEEDIAVDISIGNVKMWDRGAMDLTLMTTATYSEQQKTNPEGVVASFSQDHYAVVCQEKCGRSYTTAFHHSLYKRGEPGGYEHLTEWNVIDISVTPDANLAVLYTGTADMPCISLYSESEKLCEFPCQSLLGRLITSFSVDILGRYIILSKGENGSQILSVLDKDGSPLDEHDTGRADLRRVACGGRYFYVLGTRCILKYEVRRGKVAFVDESVLKENIEDIAATPADQVYGAWISGGEWYRKENDVTRIMIARIINNGMLCYYPPEEIISRTGFEGKSKIKLDMSDHWLMVARGRTWKHYSINPK